jgi:hypothetical protein
MIFLSDLVFRHLRKGFFTPALSLSAAFIEPSSGSKKYSLCLSLCLREIVEGTLSDDPLP